MFVEESTKIAKEIKEKREEAIDKTDSKGVKQIEDHSDLENKLSGIEIE
jgi:hypothetical protein